jgi:hypothetical protein
VRKVTCEDEQNEVTMVHRLPEHASDTEKKRELDRTHISWGR